MGGRTGLFGRFVFVAGTRPEAVKLAPIILEMAGRGAPPVLVATGQQREMLAGALATFGLVPDIDLAIMRPGQTPDQVLGRLVPRLARLFRRIRPAAVVVQGDTATAFAGATAAFYTRQPLAHVEAGLRSGDVEPHPEEQHRRLIAQLADLHFAPTQGAAAALRAEGIAPTRIHITGNSGIDALMLVKAGLAAGRPAAVPAGLASGRRPLLLATIHRRENQGARLDAVLAALAMLAADADICIPVHPAPRVADRISRTLGRCPGVTLLPPLAYGDFVWLLSQAALVLTDSGGIQEEAPALGVPVLVLRDVTERQEGLASGNARLVGTATADIVSAVRGLLGNAAARSAMTRPAHPYGDGRAAGRIADLLLARWGVSAAGRRASPSSP